jgi:hypothetical protein
MNLNIATDLVRLTKGEIDWKEEIDDFLKNNTLYEDFENAIEGEISEKMDKLFEFMADEMDSFKYSYDLNAVTIGYIDCPCPESVIDDNTIVLNIPIEIDMNDVMKKFNAVK